MNQGKTCVLGAQQLQLLFKLCHNLCEIKHWFSWFLFVFNSLTYGISWRWQMPSALEVAHRALGAQVVTGPPGGEGCGRSLWSPGA